MAEATKTKSRKDVLLDEFNSIANENKKLVEQRRLIDQKLSENRSRQLQIQGGLQEIQLAEEEAKAEKAEKPKK